MRKVYSVYSVYSFCKIDNHFWSIYKTWKKLYTTIHTIHFPFGVGLVCVKCMFIQVKHILRKCIVYFYYTQPYTGPKNTFNTYQMQFNTKIFQVDYCKFFIHFFNASENCICIILIAFNQVLFYFCLFKRVGPTLIASLFVDSHNSFDIPSKCSLCL